MNALVIRFACLSPSQVETGLYIHTHLDPGFAIAVYYAPTIMAPSPSSVFIQVRPVLLFRLVLLSICHLVNFCCMRLDLHP